MGEEGSCSTLLVIPTPCMFACLKKRSERNLASQYYKTQVHRWKRSEIQDMFFYKQASSKNSK